MKTVLAAMLILFATSAIAQETPSPERKPDQTYSRQHRAPRHVAHHRHHRKHVVVVHHRRHHAVKRAHGMAG